MCALWPVCPVYCAYAWTTHLKATVTMPNYWRKFVREDGCEDEAEHNGKARRARKLHIDVEIDEKVAEQSGYLMSLIERLKALKKRKRGAPSNELVAHVTVCRGQPEWATPIVALMAEQLRDARPGEQQPALGSHTKQVALKLLLEQAPYMRHKSAEFVPLLEHLWVLFLLLLFFKATAHAYHRTAEDDGETVPASWRGCRRAGIRRGAAPRAHGAVRGQLGRSGRPPTGTVDRWQHRDDRGLSRGPPPPRPARHRAAGLRNHGLMRSAATLP
jgi:hypothetical protein